MTILEFISKFIWPTGVLIILWCFRKRIRTIVDRLQEARGPGGWGATFRSDDQAVAPQAATGDFTFAERRLGRRVGKVTAKWEKTANTYWAGYDICNAMHGLMLGAGKRDLLYLLGQCHHHVQCLEFSDKSMEDQFSKLIDDVKSATETRLDRATRHKLAQDVLLLRDEVGAYMERNQPGFIGFPQGSVT